VNRHRPGLGVLLMLAAVGCFAALDAAVKWTGAVVPVALILWCRYATQAAVMAVWLARRSGERASAGPADGAADRSPPGRWRPGHPRFQAVRGVLLLLTSALSMWGLQHMPVAEFTAIHMLAPVLVTVLAAWWLHERVPALRWALVVGGFAGALIVIRPGSGVFGWAVLFPLAGALCYAAFQVLTRRMSALEDPLLTHFWTGAVGTLLMAPVLWVLVPDLGGVVRGLTATQLGLMLLIGLAGTLGHLAMILAFGFAPASTLMPYLYTQIPVAAVVGWFVFGHLPDGWAWVGMAVIAACGAASVALGLRARPEASAAAHPTTGGREAPPNTPPGAEAGEAGTTISPSIEADLTGQSAAWPSTSRSTPTTPSRGC
jgi:drug/metabolite transporter (DMT)-like permease